MTMALSLVSAGILFVLLLPPHFLVLYNNVMTLYLTQFSHATMLNSNPGDMALMFARAYAARLIIIEDRTLQLFLKKQDQIRQLLQSC